jgi:transposase
MNVNTVGLDIAKNIFHAFTITEDGEILKKVLNRKTLLVYFSKRPKSLIGIEACGSSHHWAREFMKLGHEVVLMNAKHVKAYLKGNKNDFNDAEAIYDCVSQPNVRPVGIKTIEQQDVQLVHSFRQELIKQKTAIINQIRGHLRERGVVIALGVNTFMKELPSILDNEEGLLSDLSIPLFREQYEHLKLINEAIKIKDKAIDNLCQTNELSQRLLEVRGIGPKTATIVSADLGKSRVYDNGRQYAASLGLVPKQHSTGGKSYLLGISKRGNKYIRTLLIHGARAVVGKIGDKQDKLSCWIRQLVKRRGYNVASVALANKNARILWSLATKETRYDAIV